MTKYFVDGDGVYIGGFDGAKPPNGAIEVPDAPQDASQTWDGHAWGAVPVVRQKVLKSVVQARIIEAGKMPEAYAALTQNPVYFARWFAPDRPEVYCDDPDAVSLLQALGLDPDAILAPSFAPSTKAGSPART
ncbi:MAG: hypothetical protein E5X59_01230 [Mesorhizobium sp.]|nr:MAG: hypothetical protein E5X59_01230 [Mesorhizobium sp.]